MTIISLNEAYLRMFVSTKKRAGEGRTTRWQIISDSFENYAKYDFHLLFFAEEQNRAPLQHHEKHGNWNGQNWRTAFANLLWIPSLDGTSSERLEVCCTAQPDCVGGGHKGHRQASVGISCNLPTSAVHAIVLWLVTGALERSSCSVLPGQWWPSLR